MGTLTTSPPWSGLGREIESCIRKAIHEYDLLGGAKKIALALSGGKDSLTLLYMLKALSGRGFPPFDLYAIHVGGEFTCGAGVSESYLRGICNQLEVPLLLRTSDQKLEELECYSCSRQRRKLIFDAAKSVGCETIAFGHHRDDLVQTLLMNLLYKGEFCGNLPKIRMHHYGVTLIRPLIFVAEEKIRTFSEQQGFNRIMCRCPVGQNSMRKKVDRLLEEIEDLFPHARENLARSSLRYGSDKAARP